MAELPTHLYRAPVKPGALVVLVRLWSYASGGARFVFPRPETLQADLGMSRTAVYQRLRELAAVRLVTRTTGRTPSGKLVAGFQLGTVCALRPTNLNKDQQRPENRDKLPSQKPGRRRPENRDAHPTRSNQVNLPRPPKAPPGGQPPIAGALDVDLPTREELERIDQDAAAKYGDPAEAVEAVDAQLALLATQTDRDADASSGEAGATLARSSSRGIRAAISFSIARASRAARLWERYEARRVELLPGTRPRAVGPQSKPRIDAHRAIVRLVAHAMASEGIDEPAAWQLVEAYAFESLDQAAVARGPKAKRLRAWRRDWSEWRRSRFNVWLSGVGDDDGTPVDPSTQDHSAEVPF